MPVLTYRGHDEAHACPWRRRPALLNDEGQLIEQARACGQCGQQCAYGALLAGRAKDCKQLAHRWCAAYGKETLPTLSAKLVPDYGKGFSERNLARTVSFAEAFPDAQMYFVAETKSTTVRDNRRPAENLKINCAREHFGLASDLKFEDVTKLSELMR